MRFVKLTIGVVAVAAAFVLGRVTVAPPAEAAIPMARAFSHFECYTAQFDAQFPGATVQLIDQFQKYKTGVGAPQMFCTPVTKKVLSGPNMKVPAPADHLTCYPIQGPTQQQQRPFANQFEVGTVVVGTPNWLCVPTNKTG
ncbi:MAG: hypothetical protein WB615_14085 [Candidatus Tumulicola sp.]